jgi:hypothetical protein
MGKDISYTRINKHYWEEKKKELTHVLGFKN